MQTLNQLNTQAILAKARNLQSHLSPTEKAAAHYLLEHYEEIVSSSIARFAQEAGVSKSSILRFCESLGFQGYKDFKIAFLLLDEESGISAYLDPRQILTVKQYTNLAYYPELIIPVRENLRRAAILKGVKKPKIFVDYQVGFMALPFQYVVDPKQEISSLNYSPFRHSDWILPLSQD